jgi:stress-induced morphogen
MVNRALGELLTDNHIHALAIKAQAPGETA